MDNGWTSQKKTLINFLVYFPKGIFFSKKYMDVTKASKLMSCYISYLKRWFCISGKNIVHMMIENASNYIIFDKLLIK